MSNPGAGGRRLLLETDRWYFRGRKWCLIRRSGFFLRCSSSVSRQAEDLMKTDARLNRLQSLIAKVRQFGRRFDFGAGFYERLVDGAESKFRFLVLPCRPTAAASMMSPSSVVVSNETIPLVINQA